MDLKTTSWNSWAEYTPARMKLLTRVIQVKKDNILPEIKGVVTLMSDLYFFSIYKNINGGLPIRTLQCILCWFTKVIWIAPKWCNEQYITNSRVHTRKYFTSYQETCNSIHLCEWNDHYISILFGINTKRFVCQPNFGKVSIPNLDNASQFYSTVKLKLLKSRVDITFFGRMSLMLSGHSKSIL